MLSRRRFGACAICAAIGLAGFKAEAQTQGAQSGGITRTVLSKTWSRKVALSARARSCPRPLRRTEVRTNLL
jgi:hypothetical protein